MNKGCDRAIGFLTEREYRIERLMMIARSIEMMNYRELQKKVKELGGKAGGKTKHLKKRLLNIIEEEVNVAFENDDGLL